MEVTVAVERAVIHEVVVQEIVEEIVLIADFRCVEHIGRMKVMHIVEVILRCSKEVIVVQDWAFSVRSSV